MEVCRLLVEHGADPNVAKRNGETALMEAARGGHMEVCRLLVEHGADPNAATSDDVTALMWAAQRGHIEVCRLLVEHGADPSAATSDGNTALMKAAEGRWRVGSAATCRQLLALGARIDAKNHAGKTALDVAWGDEVKTLLRDVMVRQHHLCSSRALASLASFTCPFRTHRRGAPSSSRIPPSRPPTRSTCWG